MTSLQHLSRKNRRIRITNQHCNNNIRYLIFWMLTWVKHVREGARALAGSAKTLATSSWRNSEKKQSSLQCGPKDSVNELVVLPALLNHWLFYINEFCILHVQLDAGDGARGEGPPEFGLFGLKRIIIAASRLWWRVEPFEYFELWNNNSTRSLLELRSR